MNSETTKRILYVEDEPDIQAVARISLESIGGFTVKVCSSGEEALDSAVGFAPDLLLLDVMMPGMDGPTTLQELRKLPEIADIPAVFMTAKVQPQEVELFMSYGAVDVIAKPFDPMALPNRISDLCQQYEVNNDSDIENQLQKLHQVYTEELPNRLSEIESCWYALSREAWLIHWLAQVAPSVLRV